MKRFIREPLLHFLIIAVLVFGSYQIVSDRRTAADQTIVVTASDIERLAALYAAEAGALPSEQDMRAMVADFIEQQALAREARRLGLADGDTVVERRLAQKMTFMISDMEAPSAPKPEELEQWYTEHEDRFRLPDRVSFQHVFFASSADDRLAASLENLSGGAAPNWRTVGDPFMLQRAYSNLPYREVERLFGSDFANGLKDENGEVGTWTGPMDSALGTHLVRITERRAGFTPELSDIRPTVLKGWQEEQGRIATRRAIGEIIDRYTIETESAR